MPEPRNDKVHLFADFTLDLARGCLRSAGELVHLRPQAYEVLKYLVENKGRLVGKDRLIETVWRGRAVTDDALVQCLIEVRNALGSKGKLYVRNVRGRGYIFDPEVAENGTSDSTSLEQSNGAAVPNNQPDGQPPFQRRDKDNLERSPVADSTSSDQQLEFAKSAHTLTPEMRPATPAEHIVSSIEHHKRAALLVSAIVMAAAVAAGAYFKYSGSRSHDITSIVVVPFANASGDENLEYLADGLTESLIDRLSRLPGVKVIARSSSFKYKGREVDPREVTRALGVQALVMGRIAQRGNDLQVRVELVDTRDGTQLWGEQYSRKATDIQAIQDEIARRISENLRLRLGVAQEQQLTRHATQDSQAYQFYLNGLFYRRKGGLENVKRALDYYNRTVALDPNFALAWAGVADAHEYFAGNSFLDPKEALAKANVAAQKALELDDGLPEAHLALTRIKEAEWDWAGAEREYKRAIELSPNLADGHSRYAHYLSLMGRHTEALEEIKRAQELDPLRIGLKRAEAWALHLARRYDEAIEKFQQAIEIEPDTNFLGLGFMYEAKGMYEQAIHQYQKAISINGEATGPLCYLGSALAQAGKRSEAQAILKKLSRTKEYVSPAELATVYTGLGDKEGALQMLEKAYVARDLQMNTLKVAPQFDSLRSDPRFRDLLRRVGFPN